MTRTKSLIALLLIFLFGLLVRLYGLNWDEGQHLHPDERFLTMYINDLPLPRNINEYLSYSSPINPYNTNQYQFFVYGTFPTTSTMLLTSLLNLKSYFYINLIGRILSAVFDSGNILLIYFFFLLIINNPKKALIASLIYASTVLPVQLSHFFAVDTFLSFFIFACFTSLMYWLYKKKYSYLLFASIFFGLAISSKISAVFFGPIIFLIFLFRFWKTRNFTNTLLSGLTFILITFISVRFFSPYYFNGVFSINHKWIDSLRSLKNYNTQYYPPSVQWLSKTKFVFPFTNLVSWSLGLPILFFFLPSFKKWIAFKKIPLFLSFLWIFYLFIFQSSQFAYTQRYYLIIFPSIIIIFSYFFSFYSTKYLITFFVFHFLYLLMFLNIYFLPHSRIQASRWIYSNIKNDAVLSCEHWDDCLPVPLPNKYTSYQTITLNLFNPDSENKWPEIINNLKQVDYVVMSSNRLWSSIPKLPQIYPETKLFYQQLFTGQSILNSNLSFKKVIQFNNYPGFSLSFLKKCIYLGPSNYPGQINKWLEINNNCLYPGIYLRDDTSEEAFTVYDHPQVLIFKKLN